MVQGHRMFLATEGKYPPIRMAMGQYEEETTQLFERLVRPGMTIFDIGAHVGYYSLLAAKLAGPTGRVHSFEPDPDNYSLLTKNVEENAYTTITAINQGAAADSGVRELFISGLDNGRHSIYRQDLPQKGSVPISTTTVDEYWISQGSPTVDLVKMDVEGAELDVFKGMEALLDGCRDIKLIVELNPALLKSAQVEPAELLNLIRSKGFSLCPVQPGTEMANLLDHEITPLIDRLYASQDSVNLYCCR